MFLILHGFLALVLPPNAPNEPRAFMFERASAPFGG
jgi:hypothetical protein